MRVREQGVKIDEATKDALKADIRRQNMSRVELARKHAVSEPTVSRWANRLGIKLPSGHIGRKSRQRPQASEEPDRRDEIIATLRDMVADLKEKARAVIRAVDQPMASGPARSRGIAMAAIALRKLCDDGSLGPLRVEAPPTGTDALVARAKEIHGEGDSLLTVLYEHVTFLSMEVRRLETSLQKRERLSAPSPRS